MWQVLHWKSLPCSSVNTLNTLKPPGTLSILFLSALGPSNAAFDGPMSSSTVLGADGGFHHTGEHIVR